MADKTGYSGMQIALHWAIAALIGANYLISEGMEESFDGMMEGQAVTGWTPTFHVWAGVTVLVLVVLRLVVRAVSGAPAAPHGGGRLMVLAGEWSRYLLYALMVAVPALGAISWFGGVDATAGLHVLAMNAMMLLIGVHAVAAIFHQYVMKDGLLARMIRPQ